MTLKPFLFSYYDADIQSLTSELDTLRREY